MEKNERPKYKELYLQDEEIIQNLLRCIFGELHRLKKHYTLHGGPNGEPQGIIGGIVNDTVYDIKRYVKLKRIAKKYKEQLLSAGIKVTDLNEVLNYDIRLTITTESGGFYILENLETEQS